MKVSKHIVVITIVGCMIVGSSNAFAVSKGQKNDFSREYRFPAKRMEQRQSIGLHTIFEKLGLVKEERGQKSEALLLFFEKTKEQKEAFLSNKVEDGVITPQEKQAVLEMVDRIGAKLHRELPHYETREDGQKSIMARVLGLEEGQDKQEVRRRLTEFHNMSQNEKLAMIQASQSTGLIDEEEADFLIKWCRLN